VVAPTSDSHLNRPPQRPITRRADPPGGGEGPRCSSRLSDGVKQGFPAAALRSQSVVIALPRSASDSQVKLRWRCNTTEEECRGDGSSGVLYPWHGYSSGRAENPGRSAPSALKSQGS
jgi:hypothetical protein